MGDVSLSGMYAEVLVLRLAPYHAFAEGIGHQAAGVAPEVLEQAEAEGREEALEVLVDLLVARLLHHDHLTEQRLERAAVTKLNYVEKY